MCGIVGYVGPGSGDFLLAGLRRLEYRGYDSAGVATIDRDGGLTITKTAGRIDRLRMPEAAGPLPGRIGIGPHPLGDARPGDRRERPPAPGRRRRGGRRPQRRDRELPGAQGAAGGRRLRFRSATDTEVIAHLVASSLTQQPHGRCGGRRRYQPLVEAVQATLAQLAGHVWPGDAVSRLSRRDGRRPAGQPAGRRRRRRRAFHRQRRVAAGRRHRQDRLPGRPRDGRRHRRLAARHPPRPGPRRAQRRGAGDRAATSSWAAIRTTCSRRSSSSPRRSRTRCAGGSTATRRRRSSAD